MLLPTFLYVRVLFIFYLGLVYLDLVKLYTLIYNYGLLEQLELLLEQCY